MAGYDSEHGPSWFRRNAGTLAALILILALAGAFRIAFNYGPAINEGNYRFAGNDDYYHLRVVQHVQTEGSHLLRDPLLNYPLGATNPRPPLYDWHVAIAGQIIHWIGGASPEKSGAYALEYGSAVWGVLICIPIWLIGRQIYSNRAGLWAAFLIAASPAHMQRAGFGLGDHDAFILFFLTLGIYFLFRALKLTSDEWSGGQWTSLAGIGQGFGEYVTTHAEGLSFALLAGLSFSAIALMWEGFPYVVAIFLLYYAIQLVFNQLRRRDSTGDLLIMLVVMTVVLGSALPYYWTTGIIHSTITSTIYLLAIMMVLSAVLVPSRGLPSLLVIPGLVGVGLLGLLVITLLLPDVGAQLFSANGYFVQSKLYSTIAEAQRTELGFFVFSIGFMTFFLALVGTGYGITRVFQKRDRDQLFIVVWALFSIYMAFAASRFVFNAAPVFALLAGWMVDKILRWMNLRERLREFQSRRHEGWTKGLRSLAGGKQIAGSIFLVFTLIVPSLWFSFDAGFPGEARANYRQNHPGAREFLDNRTGAFGQGFLATDWIDIYGWLEGQDAVSYSGEPLSCENRPAHMAWWDYGFWEVALGCHPTVSDNFQNGYQLSGRFLAAQSEQEAIEWMIIRLLEGDRSLHGARLTPPVQALLEELNPGLSARIGPDLRPSRYDQARAELHQFVEGLEEAVELHRGLSDATGKFIGYFLTDLRMLPLDFPDTPSIEAGSIFYAPVFLSNKNPDDFVQTVYVDQRGTEYSLIAYEFDAQGNSVQLSQPRVEDGAGNLFFVSGGGVYRAASDGKNIDYSFNGGNPIPLQTVKLQFKEPFYQTMFYKGYVGGEKPVQGDYAQEFLAGIPNAAKDLKHFRLVRSEQSIRLLKYYEGALVTGTATFGPTGEPLAGWTVETLDDMGIRHDRALTDANGTYQVLLPFGIPDDNGTLQDVRVRLVSPSGGLDVSNASFQVTEAQARRIGEHRFTKDMTVLPGTVTGFVYDDVDRNAEYNATIDRPAASASVYAEDDPSNPAVTDSQGRFTIPNLVPGQKVVQASLTDYAAYRHPPIGLNAGEVRDVTLILRPALVDAGGNLTNPASGEPVQDLSLEFLADDPARDYTANATVSTNETGAFSVRLEPGGGYTLRVDSSTVENGTTVRYRGSYSFQVPIGSPPIAITNRELALTRTEEGPT